MIREQISREQILSRIEDQTDDLNQLQKSIKDKLIEEKLFSKPEVKNE